MANVVLDASALLAWLNEEKGAGEVENALNDACIGAVNLSEAGARLLEAGVPEDHLGDALDIGLEVIPFDTTLALAAAQLRGMTRPYGLGLGDRACLALGWKRKLPILTADSQWKKIEVGGIELNFIR